MTTNRWNQNWSRSLQFHLQDGWIVFIKCKEDFFHSVLSVDVFSAPIFNVNVAAAVVVVKLIIWHNLDRLIQRSLLLPSSRFFSSQTNLIVVSLSRKHHPHTVYLFLLLHIHSTPRYFKKGLTFKHKLICSNYVGFADQL